MITSDEWPSLSHRELHGELHRELRGTLHDTLRPLVAGASSVALLDFPAYANVGDSAIWMGALEALRAVGAPAPCYTCDAGSYEPEVLRRRIGDGVILINGGGNFGDLWSRHQDFRQRVLADFPAQRIVQLPQSVHFQDAATLARVAERFNAHPRVTLMARDVESLEIFRTHFRAPSVLAPDLALALEPLARRGPSLRDVLWLKRSDQEDRWPGAAPASSADVEDWATEPPSPLVAWSDRLRVQARHRPWLRGAARAMLHVVHPRLARTRLRRGVAMLSSARVIVTDRLHGHILAFLLGIPHVLLDNSYGKLHRFAAAWTGRSPLVHCADSPAAAAAAARNFLASHRR